MKRSRKNNKSLEILNETNETQVRHTKKTTLFLF